ncbi:hypothetical protein ACRDU6_21070 [Mycolicibacterium sp. ELW1]|uniref:hypothetical protein n=1 Tax=Mycobacteriaceae TaxID=1762 RepID=UPI0011EF36E0|nr:hypothetical protein [Mycobacterium sp. ELW1]QEN14833.1 hypothetical protein D3H54_17605 [Mycobacterium sp. ELW1]
MNHQDVAGVPADAVYAIGAITLGAGRLENIVRVIAADLYEYPGKSRTSDLVKHIRRCGAQPNLPAHATATGPDIVKWADEVRDALKQRDEVLHSVGVKIFDGSVWEPHLVHMRTQEPTPADAVTLLHLSQKLLALSARGSGLLKGLRHSPRLGVFIPNTVVDDKWQPICDTDIGGADLARPTEAELDDWWKTYGPFPKLGKTAS